MTMLAQVRPSPRRTTIAVVVAWPDDIGNRVRVARTAAGFSREELAEEADIGYDRLGIIERGGKRPRKPEVWAIARVTRTPEAFFEGGSLTLPASEPMTPGTPLPQEANAVAEVLLAFIQAVARAFDDVRALIPDPAAADEALAKMRAQMDQLHRSGLGAEAPSTSSTAADPTDRPSRASKRGSS